jgi:hypothetical protein
MRRVLIIPLGLLAACHASPEQKAAENQRDVALVKQANQSLPPLEEVVPEPLTAADIERYDLVGQQCAYAPGTSLGTLVVAREADAFAKIDGAVERFAADPGSRALPEHSRSLYSSKTYSLRVDLSGAGTPGANGKAQYEGTVELRDAHGRVV